MALLAQAYHLDDNDIGTLTVTLKQLNIVEEAEEDIHEVRACLFL